MSGAESVVAEVRAGRIERLELDRAEAVGQMHREYCKWPLLSERRVGGCGAKVISAANTSSQTRQQKEMTLFIETHSERLAIKSRIRCAISSVFSSSAKWPASSK